MYHRIVARRTRAIFHAINTGDYEPMLAGLASPFEYQFHGEHCLAGRRTTVTAMRAWWERVFRLMPQVRFEPAEILVVGWPWNTRIAVSATVSGPLPDGSVYQNTLNQFMRLRWGRITQIRTLEDTEVLRRALDVLAASGVTEAHAAPITDETESSNTRTALPS